MKQIFTLAICLFGFWGASISQEMPATALAYRSNIPLDQETVSGGYYVDPPPTIQGDPYFRSKNFGVGTLTVNGIKYENLPLLYNIYTDEIITFHPEHKQRVLIKTDKINAFSILEQPEAEFVKISENPSYFQHGNGFYELLDSGRVDLLCKHYKTRKEKREFSKYTSEFLEKSDYWLRKGDELRLVRKKGDLMEFLEVDKKELRQLLKDNKLLFKSNMRVYILTVVSSFNEIAP